MDVLILELKDINHKIIIVDNGSNDGTVEAIEKFKLDNGFYECKIVKNETNEGISKGKNKGLDLCTGEYVLMLDGDVVPVHNSIINMITWLDENKDKVTIGMYPNKFTTTPQDAEIFCRELVNIKESNSCCIFYGLYRRRMFEVGLRMNEDGLFGEEGYGWEDHDFYERMKAMGYKQYIADINSNRGRYFHKINSSVRVMGREKYMETSRNRAKQFHEMWDA